MTIPEVDDLDRTTLLLMHRHNLNFEQAQTFKDTTGLTLTAAAAVCASPEGQAALVTAVAVGTRAFGTVEVLLDNPGQHLTGGVWRGMTLADVVLAEGAHLGPASATSVSGRHSTVALREAGDGAPEVDLLADWSQWTATVTPSVVRGHGEQAEGNVLSAITAAALVVAEAFLKIFIAEPGSDAGYREVSLDLFAPGASQAAPEESPALAYAPASWWLLGLGHLGQAYAHVISWLDYAEPHKVEVVLQDTDVAIPANHSTGVLTPRDVDQIHKTRLVAAKLERAGLTTRIIEQRLDNLSVKRPQEMHTALIGVDNLEARRLITPFGWNSAVDVGLGADLAGFDGITLRRFPGSLPSHEVPGWLDREEAPRRIELPDIKAFHDMHKKDPCGALLVAGTAVGVSFVGVVAACLAVAEVARDLHGGLAHSVMTYNLGEASLNSAEATGSEPAIATSLTVL